MANGNGKERPCEAYTLGVCPHHDHLVTRSMLASADSVAAMAAVRALEAKIDHRLENIEKYMTEHSRILDAIATRLQSLQKRTCKSNGNK